MTNDSNPKTLSVVSRRTFLQLSGALSAAAVLSKPIFVRAQDAATPTYGEIPPDALTGTIRYRFSVCQNCHSRCGLMAKVVDGVLVKLDGNPFHPNNREEDERLAYATDVSAWGIADYEKNRGRLCPKGQSGVQVVYDPYRIKHPLKRAGARGENKWSVITWDQALTEIADKMKSLIPIDRRVTDKIYSDDTSNTIGFIANQAVYSPGRSTDKDFTTRFWKSAFGTKNYDIGHTSICEVTRHIGNELITGDQAGKTGIVKTKGKNNWFRADVAGCNYLIMWGANWLEANFPMLALSRKVVELKKRGGKLVVVDPRLSHSAAKADRWLPVKPGGDGALALGMARWIIENNKYDAAFLKHANQAAANSASTKEYSWTDSTYLVMLRKDDGTGNAKKPGDKLQTQHLDSATYGGNFGNSSYTDKANKVAWNGTTPVEVKVSSTAADAVDGTLETGELTLTPASGIASADYIWSDGKLHCASSFTLLKARVLEKTIDEYAQLSGIDAATIQTVAGEFAAAGKKAAADHYRGPVKHTNGIYSHFACMLLNTLVGNYDWKGGTGKGGGGYGMTTGVVDVTKVPNGVKEAGVGIDRSPGHYDGTYLFTRDGGYPAKRPWFPFGFHKNYQEFIPGANDQYPYPVKVAFLYWNALPYSTPALRTVYESTLKDENKIPLAVGITPMMGEAYEWCDYVLPECGYLERWSFPGISWASTKGTPFRQPVIGTFDGKSWDAAFDPNAPNAYTSSAVPDARLLEDIFIGLAQKLGLPGHGSGGMDGGRNLDRAWDFIKAELENLVKTQGKTSISEIIAKGGVFDDPGTDYDGAYLKHRYADHIKIYIEPLATTKDSITGKFHDPLPKHDSIRRVDDQVVDDSASYPLQLVTYKSVLHGQARTIQCPWMVQIGLNGSQYPYNYVEMNASDAAKLDISTGDTVKVTSPSNTAGVTGKAWVTEGIRPGVVGISHHFGHWAEGSKPRTENGSEFKTDDGKQGYDPNRGLGIQPGLIMRLDDSHAARGATPVSLQDKIGSSVSFFDTWIKVEKA